MRTSANPFRPDLSLSHACLESGTNAEQEKEDGPLSKFWEAINDFGQDFVVHMRNMKDLTVFAPSNEAWNDPNLQNIIRNKHRMSEILNLHLVRDRLNTEKIKNNNANQVKPLCLIPLITAIRPPLFPLFCSSEDSLTEEMPRSPLSFSRRSLKCKPQRTVATSTSASRALRVAIRP